MSMNKRSVSVHQIPGTLSSASQMELLRRFELSVEGAHPRFVLDCAQMDMVGAAEIYFLLCCLEEAMKHNGDVRLAGLRAQAKTSLRQAGIAHMFEIYDNVESAVRSYQVRPSSTIPLGLENIPVDTGYAA